MDGYDGNGAIEYDLSAISHQVVNGVRLAWDCSFCYVMDGYDGTGALEYA